MTDIYRNTEDYNPNKKREILTVFDYVIANMLSNKEPNLLVTKLFIRDRKLNISPVVIIQSYFAVSKDIQLNSAHDFIMKIPNKWELKQIVSQNSSDITFKTINLYKKCTAKPYSFLVVDNTLSLDNPSRFRKNLLEPI